MNALLEQEALTLVFVSLGGGIIGIGFGWNKTKDFLKMHRFVMTSVIIMNIMSIFVVMFPSLISFYSDPVIPSMYSSFSNLQIIHSIVGIPTMTLGLSYAFNRLPKSTKMWMRVTTIIWLTSIILGAIVYFTIPN